MLHSRFFYHNTKHAFLFLFSGKILFTISGKINGYFYFICYTILKKEMVCMNQMQIDKTKEYLKTHMPKVLKADLVQIVMYGSCARGDYGELSDIDIALITNCDRMEAKKYDDSLMDIVTDIAMELGTIVEYICIPLNEYNEKKTWYGYFKNIEKEGLVIYG